MSEQYRFDLTNAELRGGSPIEKFVRRMRAEAEKFRATLPPPVDGMYWDITYGTFAERAGDHAWVCTMTAHQRVHSPPLGLNLTNAMRRALITSLP